jgi:hypothetical protein
MSTCGAIRYAIDALPMHFTHDISDGSVLLVMLIVNVFSWLLLSLRHDRNLRLVKREKDTNMFNLKLRQVETKRSKP